MPDVSRVLARFGGLKRLFGGDWKTKLIVLLGLLGMALILLAQITSKEKHPAQDTPQDTDTAQFTLGEYQAQLESRLGSIIASIDGVGQARVMITLEHGGESIYATEEKSSVDKASEEGGYKQDRQYSYVMVDTGYGEKQPLVKTQTPPKVQGVVIVCEGADDILVQERLTNVVTTALHIPTTRVCVVKINPNQ